MNGLKSKMHGLNVENVGTYVANKCIALEILVDTVSHCCTFVGFSIELMLLTN